MTNRHDCGHMLGNPLEDPAFDWKTTLRHRKKHAAADAGACDDGSADDADDTDVVDDNKHETRDSKNDKLKNKVPFSDSSKHANGNSTKHAQHREKHELILHVRLLSRTNRLPSRSAVCDKDERHMQFGRKIQNKERHTFPKKLVGRNCRFPHEEELCLSCTFAR